VSLKSVLSRQSKGAIQILIGIALCIRRNIAVDGPWLKKKLSYYGQFPHFRNIIKALEEEKMTNTKKVRRQASRDRDKISAPN
jgi:hypothetical protein